jgi:hypothetical protein
MTVFAILVAPSTSRVLLTVSDGSKSARVSTDVQPLALEANRAGGLRFAVVVIPGGHCVESLAAQSASGKALWQGIPAAHHCAGVE